MLYGYDPYEAIMGMMMVLLIPLIILGCIIPIILGVWVYKDAEKRGMDNTVWLIIVLLVGCLGCIIYLIVRKPIGGEQKAPPSYTAPTTTQATTPYEERAPAPPETGKPIEKDKKFCPTCGASIPAQATFCPHCGSKV